MDTPSTSKSEQATERDDRSPVVGEGSASTQVETKHRQAAEKAPKSKPKTPKSQDALRKTTKSKAKKAKDVVTSESNESDSLSDSNSDESNSTLSESEEDSESETEKEKRKRKAKKKAKQKAKDKRKAKSKKKAKRAVCTPQRSVKIKADRFRFHPIPTRIVTQILRQKQRKILKMRMMTMRH